MNNTRKIQQNGQVTIPMHLRKQAGLDTGDVVEFTYQSGKIFMTPKVVKCAQETPLMKAIRATHQEAKRQGLDKMSMKQINAEIAAYRKEKRQQQPNPRGK